MQTVEQALALILQEARPLPPERVSLQDAITRTLAQDVLCDLDSPPYDKALMDGFAIRADSVERAPANLRVVETVTAGGVPNHPVELGEAARIMTGAMLPSGADAVVMFEETTSQSDDEVCIQKAVRVEQNILRRGTVMRRGDRVAQRGAPITPMVVGLLGEVGCADVEVYRRPTVSVLATGDELVDVGITPPTGSIRNSNGPMLAGFASSCGALTRDLGVGRDDAEQLEQRMRDGLRDDVLVLSGGVSAGDLDLVPATLERLEVQCVFHGIQLKPGKPLWFGVLKDEQGTERSRTLVFGLPGNPVSSLVCFHLFVAPALRALAGTPDATPMRFTGRVSHDWSHRGGRPTYFPAVASPHPTATEIGASLRLCPWKGSADQRSLVEANALAILPADPVEYKEGDAVPFVWI